MTFWAGCYLEFGGEFVRPKARDSSRPRSPKKAMLEAHSRLRTTKVSANLALPEEPASLFRRPYGLDGHRKTQRTPPIQRFQAGRPAKAPPNSRSRAATAVENRIADVPGRKLGSGRPDRSATQYRVATPERRRERDVAETPSAPRSPRHGHGESSQLSSASTSSSDVPHSADGAVGAGPPRKRWLRR